MIQGSFGCVMSSLLCCCCSLVRVACFQSSAFVALSEIQQFCFQTCLLSKRCRSSPQCLLGLCCGGPVFGPFLHALPGPLVFIEAGSKASSGEARSWAGLQGADVPFSFRTSSKIHVSSRESRGSTTWILGAQTGACCNSKMWMLLI